MKERIIIDFEFTGLNNSYILNNEIVQFKALNLSNNKTYLKNFKTNIPSTKGAYLKHKIDNSFCQDLFNKDEFILSINSISNGDVDLLGWGVELDKKMLLNSKITVDITDIREMAMFTKYEQELALGGNSLETAYYVITGKEPKIKNHGDVDELFLMKDILEKIDKLEKHRILNFMPYGHCAGMPLEKYVVEYRRQADGYRYNNNDLLSKSLDIYIDNIDDYKF